VKESAVAGDVCGDLVPALLPQHQDHPVPAPLVVLDQGVERPFDVIGIGVALSEHRRSSRPSGLLDETLSAAELPQDRLHRHTRSFRHEGKGDRRDGLLGREFDHRADDADSSLFRGFGAGAHPICAGCGTLWRGHRDASW
jgi:hypothetical protein